MGGRERGLETGVNPLHDQINLSDFLRLSSVEDKAGVWEEKVFGQWGHLTLCGHKLLW